jgi:hypothetical protein
LLKQRFAEFGPDGTLFFDELLRTRHHGKDEAVRVLRLLAAYRREDLIRALEHRLVEGAIILKVKGKSYRAQQAKPSEENPS